MRYDAWDCELFVENEVCQLKRAEWSSEESWMVVIYMRVYAAQSRFINVFSQRLCAIDHVRDVDEDQTASQERI